MSSSEIQGLLDGVPYGLADREEVLEATRGLTDSGHDAWFDALTELQVEAVQWDSRADTFRLRLVTADDTAVHFGAFDAREQAERARAELLSVLRRHGAPAPAENSEGPGGTESAPEE